jgi:hypothetical protein
MISTVAELPEICRMPVGTGSMRMRTGIRCASLTYEK